MDFPGFSGQLAAAWRPPYVVLQINRTKFALASNISGGPTSNIEALKEHLMKRLVGWISTLLLATMSAAAATGSYQGLWEASPTGPESGWSLRLTQHGRTVSADWTAYPDVNYNPSRSQNPAWSYSVTATQTGPNTFAGNLYRQPKSEAPDRNAVALHPVIQRVALGSAKFVFTDDNNGTLTYQEITYSISRLPDTVSH
jgi:hypothetical protein